VIAGVPFITYYPAIILATFLGGLWPGILAVILSSAAACLLFLPPAYSWDLGQKEALATLLFVLVSGVDVALITLLNVALERVLAQ